MSDEMSRDARISGRVVVKLGDHYGAGTTPPSGQVIGLAIADAASGIRRR
jgi:hypothetical protein